MKRPLRGRRLCIRVSPQEEELFRQLHRLLGGGAHSFSETFREAAVLFSAFVLEQRPPPITFQRERYPRKQLQERLLRRAEALSSGVASPTAENRPPARAVPPPGAPV